MENASHKKLVDALRTTLPDRTDIKEIVDQMEKQTRKYVEESARREAKLGRRVVGKRFIG